MRSLSLLVLPLIAIAAHHLTKTTAWVGSFELAISIGLVLAGVLTVVAIVGR